MKPTHTALAISLADIENGGLAIDVAVKGAERLLIAVGDPQLRAFAALIEETLRRRQDQSARH